MKLYVGGLAYSVTDQELNDFFATEGTVANAFVVKDKFSGKSKGFGFVEFEDDQEAQNAIKALDGKDLNGRAIVVNEARPQEERPRGSGGGGSRGFGGGNGGGGRGGFGGGRDRDNNRRRY